MPDWLLPPLTGQLGVPAGLNTAMATAGRWGRLGGSSGTCGQRGQGCSAPKAPSEHSKQALKPPPAHPPGSSTAAAPGALPRHGSVATDSPGRTQRASPGSNNMSPWAV